MSADHTPTPWRVFNLNCVVAVMKGKPTVKSLVGPASIHRLSPNMLPPTPSSSSAPSMRTTI